MYKVFFNVFVGFGFPFGSTAFVNYALPKTPSLFSTQYLYDEIKADIDALPIKAIIAPIKDALEEKPNLLLEASPGAGKTTIVPLLLSSFDSVSNVVVVEPRRVAARSAAQRMASLIDEAPGKRVGYAIRGESRMSSETRISVMTDGVLLNKIREDPELNGIDVVILDEFHERGIGSDTAFALCREIQMNFRPDLKIIVMSATLLGDIKTIGDNDDPNLDFIENESVGTKLLSSLGGSGMCNVLRSEGRQFPVSIQHAKRSAPPLGLLLNDNKLLVKTMTDTIEDSLLKTNGDVLVFLPGVKEIKRVVNELKFRNLGTIDIYPLYGALPKEEQDLAIKSGTRRRKIIVSSPIAEASLTIEGVTCVIDSGLQRQPRYDSTTGLPSLVTVICSQDSAIQRMGRAGRVSEGLCVRLYTEGDFNRMSISSTPEIMSTDLVPTSLLLTEFGYGSIEEIQNEASFIDPPPKNAMEKAFSMLADIEAVEEIESTLSENLRSKRFRVTPHGENLLKLSTHPRLATCIAIAEEKGSACLAGAIFVAAILDENLGSRESNLCKIIQNFIRESEKGANLSFDAKKVLQFASRISVAAYQSLLDTFQGKIKSEDVLSNVGYAILPGFTDLVARRKSDASYGGSTYMLSLGQSVYLDRRDEDEFLIVLSTSTSDDNKTRIRSYVKIQENLLRDIAEEVEEVYTVASKGYEVRAKKVKKVGALQLESIPVSLSNSGKIAEVLLNTIQSLGGVFPALKPLQSKKDLIAIQDLICRVRLARKLSSDEDWPDCFRALDALENGFGEESANDEIILQQLVENWMAGITSLKDLNLLSILDSTLDQHQIETLQRLFPTKINAPDGTTLAVNYKEVDDHEVVPTVDAKLQQFFGLLDSPRVGYPHDSVPISLSLLSPANKPLAQTLDLPFFWKEVYPTVRAEMRGKYPKHPWPDDPVNATPSRKTKKQQAKDGDETNVPKVNKRKEKSLKRKKRKGS